MPWRWEWNITGRRHSRASSKIRLRGMWGRHTDMEWDSIRYFFLLRCTAWRRICMRCLCRRRGQARRDRVSAAAEGLAAVVDSQAADLAAAAAAAFSDLQNWCARRDSNSQPSAPKADALSD